MCLETMLLTMFIKSLSYSSRTVLVYYMITDQL